jgi:UDP-2-acetamido-3-amino-2,3-dideoxy-glucuronate N-acetyltransferase
MGSTEPASAGGATVPQQVAGLNQSIGQEGVGFAAHESAFVEPGASIGRGTRIWHRAQVRSGARVGEDCTIGRDVYVDTGAFIGSRVKIQNGVYIYEGVTVEDEVLIGPGAVFTNDRYPRAVSPGWRVVPTIVRQGATIGANATIVCGNEIGRWAMVGAGATVVRPVEEHELVAGNPARRLGWACACGRTVARTPERPIDLRCDGCRRTGRPK